MIIGKYLNNSTRKSNHFAKNIIGVKQMYLQNNFSSTWKGVNFVNENIKNEERKLLLKHLKSTIKLQDLNYLLSHDNKKPHIHKCVEMVTKYPELTNYLKEYLSLNTNVVNTRCINGRTALHVACDNLFSNNTAKITKVLLDYDIDTKAVDNKGAEALLPLHSFEDVIEMVVDFNAKFDKK